MVSKLKIKSKWKKVGVCRLSRSGKVLKLSIFELGRSRWFILDVEDLFEVVAGHRSYLPIFELEKRD